MKLDFFYPMSFEPLYKSYIWGGKKISQLRHLPEETIAESWEIVDRELEQSVVAEGPLQGKRLHELMGEDLLGVGRSYERFPLLIKFIDAAKHLSVQVHPDEVTAKILQGESKNEAWCALDAHSKVLAGLKQGVGRKELEQSLLNSSLPSILQEIELHRNELLFIPAGTVHAILSGSFLLEVQENSDTTYRIYDWDRKDQSGKKRELHLNEALQAIHWDASPEKTFPPLQTPFFQINRMTIEKRKFLPSDFRSFHIYFLLTGELDIRAGGITLSMEKYRAYLVPAKADSTELMPKTPSSLLTISL